MRDSDGPSKGIGGVKGGGAPLQGQQFRSQMFFYYTKRGAHI